MMRLQSYSILVMLLLLASACSSPVSTSDKEPVTTQIHYTLTKDTHVEIWLENSYETRVKTLLDKYAQAGSYNVTFKMVDKNGNKLSPGLYRYCINTDEQFSSH